MLKCLVAVKIIILLELQILVGDINSLFFFFTIIYDGPKKYLLTGRMFM